jgi:hypothetical protein
MSEISRELQEQQGDVGAVMRKLFPEAPSLKPSVTDTNQAARRAYEEAASARAKMILDHVRELGDDY